MQEPIDLDQLRTQFISAPESQATRFFAIVVSAALLIIVLWLLRRGKLREEYTPIWLGLSAALLVVSINFDILRWFTNTMGAWTTSSTVFFLGELFLLAICLGYAVRLSSVSLQLKNLSQEMAILKTQLETLRREKSPSASGAEPKTGDPTLDEPGGAPAE